MLWHTLFRSRSLVVVHTNLIAITYLIADHDVYRLLDRDRLDDSGYVLNRLIAGVIFPMPITPSPYLVPFARRA